MKQLDPLTENFARRHGERCARTVVTAHQKHYYRAVAAGLLLLLVYRWDLWVMAVGAVLACWYLGALFFRGYAALRGFLAAPPPAPAPTAPADCPVYTILAPLYREARVADKILRSLAKLDYPADKLDILLLLEADDDTTRDALLRAGLPANCRIVTAPDTLPRTKPRACNYGLAEARGEFCVIFDAEDVPEPDQLRKALAVFAADPDGKIACVQAKLNYFNADTNLLTRLFTVEYTMHFDLLLPGMAGMRLPLPLGGTSNHFRTAILREIGPWDPYNVTEDCDLGLRIYEAGYRTSLIDSTTWEEANCRLENWLRQRSRWVKGFAQTHFVHFRSWRAALKQFGVRGACAAFLAVGGSVAMMLTNLIFWGIGLAYAALLIHGVSHGIPVAELVTGPHPDWPDYRGFCGLTAWPLVYAGPGENPIWAGISQLFFGTGVVLFLANFFWVALAVLACVRRRFYRLIPWALLMPFYWILISVGAWKGCFQLLTKPFYWEKTEHGIDREAL